MENLLSTILQWSIPECRNEHLYLEKVKQIPSAYDNFPHWTEIFKAHVFEDMRASVAKDLNDFSLSQTLYELERITERPRKDSSKCDPKRFASRGIKLALDGDIPGAIVIFVKYGGSNLTNEIMVNAPHFFGSISKKRRDDESGMFLEVSDGATQQDFLTNDGAGWMMFILATGHIPNLRILDGLQNCKMRPEMITEMLTCKPSQSALPNNTEDFMGNQAIGLLNPSQSLAISRAFAAGKSGPHIQIIEGPPGTGKTSTLIGLIHTFLEQTHHRIHVTAPTNHAVCELARRAVSSFIPRYSARSFVLVGKANRLVMSDDLRDIHLDTTVKCLLTASAMWTSTVNQLKVLWRSNKDGTSGEAGSVGDSVNCPQKSNAALSLLLRECQMYAHSFASLLPDNFISDPFRKMLFNGIEAITDFEVALQKAHSHVIPPELLENEKIEELMGYTLSGVTKKAMTKALLKSARVVFSTVSEGQSGAMDAKDFNVVIIDEATQLVEASTAILLSPTLECLVLVGDDKQLPPTVISNLAKSRGYGVSLFDRLLHNKFPTTLLNTQYRMHPSISRWPNKQFYEGKIMDGDNVRSEKYTKSWHDEFPPFIIYDVNGKEEETEYGSYYNKLEVDLLKLLLRKLYGVLKNSTNEDILKVGIITPYKGQLSLVTDQTLGLQKGLSSKMNIVCKTVDGFQGQECDIIFFLSTRSKKVGFLDDKRRLNVAMTRAKYCMIFIGNITFLTGTGQLWRNLVESGADSGQTPIDAASSAEVARVEKKQISEDKMVENFEKRSTDALFESTLWYQKVKIMDSFKKSFPLILDKKRRGRILVALEGISNGDWPENHHQAVNIEGFEEIIKHVSFSSHVLLWSVDLDVSTTYVMIYLKR